MLNPTTAVTWLKYCRYGVKLYSNNQSILPYYQGNVVDKHCKMAVHWLTDWLIVYAFLLFHSYSIWKLSVHLKGCKIKTSLLNRHILLLCLPRPIMIRGSEVIHIFSAIFVTNNLVHSLEEIPLVNELFAGCKCAMLFQKPNHHMVDRRPIYDYYDYHRSSAYPNKT